MATPIETNAALLAGAAGCCAPITCGHLAGCINTMPARRQGRVFMPGRKPPLVIISMMSSVVSASAAAFMAIASGHMLVGAAAGACVAAAIGGKVAVDTKAREGS
eukprot:TRINITY_DN28158_c0_g1_i1.p5 TRINITY_DN28158_c0_g1~~TRINITY_DN28158_c0_g1_i1.p5  ORF type:complete len:105 (+),score=16.82 TRINITY_DN28158_c0_g1_i1:162-476(+)